MTTSILFTHSGGTPVPDVLSIPVSTGDSFELSVAGEGKAVVYFSPALAAIVTPAPDASVTLTSGSPARFTFASAGPGAYSLVSTAEGEAAPTHFRSGPSIHVSVASAVHSSSVAFPVDGGRTSSNN